LHSAPSHPSGQRNWKKHGELAPTVDHAVADASAARAAVAPVAQPPSETPAVVARRKPSEAADQAAAADVATARVVAVAADAIVVAAVEVARREAVEVVTLAAKADRGSPSPTEWLRKKKAVR